MLVLLIKRFMKYTVEMASCGMIYIPSYMKIGTDIQAILRCLLRNLRDCNAGIAGGRDI
jgi:hypothetical protein